MKKAQTSLEYTLVVAIFVAALISMQVYIKRGFQGSYRQSADQIGSAYEPKNTTSDTSFFSDSNSVTNSNTQDVDEKYETTIVSTTNDTTWRWGSEEVGPLK